MLEKFLEDGNVVVGGVLDWIVKDSELIGMVDAEFEMYGHHLREQNREGELWMLQEHVALVGAAGDETGPGILRVEPGILGVEHGCTSGRELQAG